jgi:prepilin-type processing-associated H-X9-DG protein
LACASATYATLPQMRASSVTDGLSHTLLVAESVDRKSDVTPAENIRWAWGANSFAQNAPFVNTPRTENIRSTHDRGANGVFADGRVMFLGDSISPDVLAAICTRNGEEKIASAVNDP